MGAKIKKLLILSATVGFIVTITCSSFSNLFGICPMGKNLASMGLDSQTRNVTFPSCHDSESEEKKSSKEGDCCDENTGTYLVQDSILSEKVVEKPHFESVPFFSLVVYDTIELVFFKFQAQSTKIPLFAPNLHHASILQVFII